MANEELEQCIKTAFSENTREAYITLSKKFDQEMDEIKSKQESLKEKNAKIFSLVSKISNRLKAIGAALTGFVVLIFIVNLILNQFTEISIGFGIEDCISYVVGIVFTIFILIFLCDNLNPLEKIEKEQEFLKERYDKLFVINGFIHSQIDLLMYQDLYDGVSKVLGYLAQNDTKGLKAFEKAAKALNLDYNKYRKEN